MLGPDEVRTRAAALATLEPSAVLAWAVGTFRDRAALTVSLNAGGLVLAHMLSGIDRTVPVLFLDTGFHFPETLAFRDRIAARLRLRIVTMTPASDPGALYASDPDRCCEIRKVEPMQRALRGIDAWISAVRRDQAETRRATEVLEYHESEGRSLVKVHPLASWTRADVARYVRQHDLPTHPLHERGYASIGCWPCTRPVASGEDERAGRWSGTAKVECGLHTFTIRARGER